MVAQLVLRARDVIAAVLAVAVFGACSRGEPLADPAATSDPAETSGRGADS
jgi:hypothetical protein